jgi:hypothetical protein
VPTKRDPQSEPTDPQPDEPKEPTEPDYIPDTPPTEPPPVPIRDPHPDSQPQGPLIARMSMTIYIRRFVTVCFLLAVFSGAAEPAEAQGRDSLLNGAIVGAAIGAGIGIGFTYALRDSDLTAGQYAYGGIVWGAIGAGVGLGVDALFTRSAPRAPRPRLLLAPAVGRVNGVTMNWRW